MTRRDKNIVKSCDELNILIACLFPEIYKSAQNDRRGKVYAQLIESKIKILNITHRIKRAVWRGEKKIIIVKRNNESPHEKVKINSMSFIPGCTELYNQHSTDY